MEQKITLENIPKHQVFQVPEGYFDAFLQRMQLRLHQSNPSMLLAAGPLAGYSVIHDWADKNIFVVPQGYFETLPEKIQQRIRLDGKRPLSFTELENFETALTTKEIYTVPEDYFEKFSEKILSKIASIRQQEPAPLDFDPLEEGELGILASVPKQNIFQIPENYFENFSVQPEVKPETGTFLPEEKEARVISLLPHWAKYAASVAAAILVMLTGYWFYPKSSEATGECTELLCNLSDEEILQYLQTQDVRYSSMQKTSTTAPQIEDNGLEKGDLSEDDLLNAAESIE